MNTDLNSNPTSNAAIYGTYMACGLCALFILFIDLRVPLGVATGVLYIVVILISLKSSNNRFTIAIAFICTLLVWIGYLGSPQNVISMEVVYINRFLSVLAIWVTAGLTLWQRNSLHQLHQERLKHLQSKKTAEIQEEKLKVLKATMYTVQDIIGNSLNNLLALKLEIEHRRTLSTDSLHTLDAIIHDTSQRINKLTNLEEVREKRMAGNLMGIEYDASVPDMAVCPTHDKLAKKSA
ncbi:hypothetical protein [Nitrosomonas sp. sh817]|uniref:hypothetical protein n=1 Tax=Nitrosomonas sp. sh817 TaxID=3070658 RepID=UPI0027DDBFB7|nr:hypothetical protein [Nitrosomonas sp. sh817]WMJ07435.1 hypothetical protein RBH92_08270 [Nitrosomonas sp. sh817]